MVQIQEIPSKNMIFLAGPPGIGKSEFCMKTVLQNLAIYRPIIYLVTDSDLSKVEAKLKDRGLGDPYCEIKVVPGAITELNDSLEAIDSTVLEKMHERLMDRLMGFLLENKPLVERPKSGPNVMCNAIMHVMFQPALAGERCRLILRMAGAKAGKKIGEHLMEAGLRRDKAVDSLLNFLEYCKVGKVTIAKTIRIKENCESVFYWFMTKKKGGA